MLDAVRELEEGMKLVEKETTLTRDPVMISSLSAEEGRWWYQYGGLVVEAFELTGNQEYLNKGAKAFASAIDAFRKPGFSSRIAECYWKAAELHDSYQEYAKAAEEFGLASREYMIAATKIPHLKAFYQDYIHYMEAWSQIENARHYHRKEDYDTAREYYDKAIALFRDTKWDYLSQNFRAWSRIETAESLSRNEKSDEATVEFQAGQKLFQETKQQLEKQLPSAEHVTEKQAIRKLIGTATWRQVYCKARIAIEEAKNLDKSGDHYGSSEKYFQAVEYLAEVINALPAEGDKREIAPLVAVSRAWQKMTRAEAEASPELYEEASRLFEETKELSLTERAKMLALGHSRFCKALVDGTRFQDTRNPVLYGTTIQQLESASSYYLKAGFDTASEYSRASRLLFDAYFHMDKANQEKDQEKRAGLYAMVERILQASADSFSKAEHLEKRDQVLRLITRVRGERALAVSLTDLFQIPSALSSTASFAAPSPSYEDASGVERFDQAVIQSSMTVQEKSVGVGETVNLQIEIANAGRTRARLVRVEDLVPTGFELNDAPAVYRAEDRGLAMKGKSLEPLAKEEVRIGLKPTRQGRFSIRPRILYVDETGASKYSQLGLVEITVRELGILGWLKGPHET